MGEGGNDRNAQCIPPLLYRSLLSSWCENASCETQRPGSSGGTGEGVAAAGPRYEALRHQLIDGIPNDLVISL